MHILINNIFFVLTKWNFMATSHYACVLQQEKILLTIVVHLSCAVTRPCHCSCRDGAF
jgi:hypothetical protein